MALEKCKDWNRCCFVLFCVLVEVDLKFPHGVVSQLLELDLPTSFRLYSLLRVSSQQDGGSATVSVYVDQ